MKAKLISSFCGHVDGFAVQCHVLKAKCLALDMIFVKSPILKLQVFKKENKNKIFESTEMLPR